MWQQRGQEPVSIGRAADCGARRGIVFLGLALLALAVACNRGQSEKPQPNVVALVNGETITTDQLDRELRRARHEDGLVPATEEVATVMRKAKLDELIDGILLDQAARAANVVIPPDRIESEVLRLRADYPGSAFDDMLAQGELSTADVRYKVQQQLITQKLIHDQVYARVAVTEPEVEAYFKEHEKEFSRPEEVRAEQIVVHTVDDAKRVQAELRKGMSFEEAARRFGLGPEAKVGGDLGYFPRGQMPAVFDKACFGKSKGTVTDVVPSEYGFHIFRIVDVRDEEEKTLAEVRGEVEAKIRRQKEEAAEKDFMAKLRAQASVTINQEALQRIRG
jgi:peptidyl-prolyl cis-trans isomerase C